MLSTSQVILQPAAHSSLTPKSKSISYSIQTVIPHCSSLPTGRIVLVPPGAESAKNNSAFSSCSGSALATSDVISRSMNGMIPASKNGDGGGGGAGHENGGSGSSMISAAPVATAPVPFIRTAPAGGTHKGGLVQVTPQQMPASSQNMQGCSPVAIQHPGLTTRHQQQQSNFVPPPKTGAASGGSHLASFYLYDDQTTTYQFLGVSPPNVTAAGIGLAQSLGQHGVPVNFNSQHSNVCGVPSVVRIPQRNTAQNRSSVTNTMQYFPVNMQQEASPAARPRFQQPAHPQSSPSQLVVSGGHSTGAPYLPPSSSGGIQHSPNWPPPQRNFDSTSSERSSFDSLTSHRQPPPPQISSEHNLLLKTEKDQSSCYRQMSAPCVSQNSMQREESTDDVTNKSSRRGPYGALSNRTTSQLLSEGQSQPTSQSELKSADSPVTGGVGWFGSNKQNPSMGVPSTPQSQQSAQSSKSSPSPVEFSPELEMDLANLPAFNFNLDEICEDVLFPEKDDFDDIFMDELTIAPTPPYTCSTLATSREKTLHNLDHGDGAPKIDAGSTALTPVSIDEQSCQKCVYRPPGGSNFGGSTFLDRMKKEDDYNNQSCHGRLEGAFGGVSLSNSPTNYADLPTRGAKDLFENMDFKSSDGSTNKPKATDGSPSRFAGSTGIPNAKSKLQVSPSPSYASCLGSAGVGNVRRRRRPGVDRPSSSGEACTICGDKASGYHYNALSCEGCKGFFRRSVTNDRKYTCERNGECNIDIYMRRKCQKCRLDRCYAAGMRKECLMSVEQCRSMQAKRKSRSGPTGPVSINTSSSGNSGGTVVLGAVMQTTPGIMSAAAGMSGGSTGSNVFLPSNAITANVGANMPPQHPSQPQHQPPTLSNQQQQPYAPPAHGITSNITAGHPRLNPVLSHDSAQRSSTHTIGVDLLNPKNPYSHQQTLQGTSHSTSTNTAAAATDCVNMPLMPPIVAVNLARPTTGDTSGVNDCPINSRISPNSCSGSVGSNEESIDTQEMTSSMQQLLISIPPQYDSEQELLDVGMSPDQVALVRNLIMDRWSVGMPNIEKIRYLPPWPGRTGDARLTSLKQDQQRQMKFQHMTHLTRICMEGVIGLAKKLRDFSKLSQQDQIRIVKPACLEILMINSAQYFDVTTDRLLMATGHWTTHEQMEDGLLKYGFGTQMWQYVRTLAQMKLHDIEFTLLTALCVYSPDRAGLTNDGRVQVSQFQQPYRNCLQIYCRSVYPQSGPPSTPSSRMSQLMSKLYELRSVSFQHSKYIYGIQLNKSNWEPLPQLLGEIFDQGNEVCSEEETSPPLNNNTVSSISERGPPGGLEGGNTLHQLHNRANPLCCSPVCSTPQPTSSPSCPSPAHPTAAVSTGAKQYATGHAPSLVTLCPHPSTTSGSLDNTSSIISPK